MTRYHHQSRAEKAAKKPLEVHHHELLFGQSCEAKRTGESGLESLREMARFLNRRNLQPRARVECAADAPNLEAYLKKCAL